MKDESQIIKTLLLKEELETLEQLKKKFLKKEHFTQEVSEIVATAITAAYEKNDKVNQALEQPINQGVLKAFTKNKQTLIDSMLPIMGQLIRKTVSNSIKVFVADINRTLELGFSAKAIKWRWQAFRSGKSFAEIVFQKTIKYQIQEMFLIDKESGLLIEHVGKEDLMKNKDAISAMLTAIQDFIGDSLQLEESELLSAEFGDSLIWISTGPHAYLASVIKGNPTDRLKVRLQQLIEKIHAEHSDELISQENYRNLPQVQETMVNNLVTKSINDSKKKINWIPWVLIPALIFSFFGYKSYQKHKIFNQIKNESEFIPGLYTQSLEKTSDGFELIGLKDPLANLESLNKFDELAIKTRPIISLDDEIISLRINTIIEAFPKIKAEAKNGVITLTGKASSTDLENLLAQIKVTQGVTKIIDQTEIDLEQAIDSIIKQNSSFNDNINFKILNNAVIFSGKTSYLIVEKLKGMTQSKYDEVEFEFSNIEILDSNDKLMEQINSQSILVNELMNNDDQTIKLFKLITNNIQTLIERSALTELEVTGFSDCNGRGSNKMSWKRVNLIADKLITQNVDKALLRTRIEECENFIQPNDPTKRNVMLTVK